MRILILAIFLSGCAKTLTRSGYRQGFYDYERVKNNRPIAAYQAGYLLGFARAQEMDKISGNIDKAKKQLEEILKRPFHKQP